MPRIVDSFPSLYRTILPEPFARDVPDEAKATCSSCAMSAENATPGFQDGSRFFRSDTKCCTYQPRLPNYLVGSILADERPDLAEGRRRISERIASGVGVTPLWLRPPRTWTVLYDQARGAFGRTLALRCPYYEATSGGCTIWAWREAVCSTFFCRYVAGADGRTFWMTTKTYLSLVEHQLARFAALQLHPEHLYSGRAQAPGQDAPLGPNDLDEQVDAAAHRATWGAWAGREEEFYRACATTVAQVTPVQLESLLGLDGQVQLEQVRRAHAQAVSPKLPRVLRLNPSASIQWQRDGSFAVTAYSEMDALALPGAAYELLAAFDGHAPVDDVRARLRDEKSADLGDEVILELYRQRVLTE